MRHILLACTALSLLAGCAATQGGGAQLAGKPSADFAGPADFADEVPGLRLDFPAAAVDRRALPDGHQFLAFSGAIINEEAARQAVPHLRLILRDGAGRAVYSKSIAPGKPALAPGERLPVNEAVMDAPASAKVMEVGWDQS